MNPEEEDCANKLIPFLRQNDANKGNQTFWIMLLNLVTGLNSQEKNPQNCVLRGLLINVIEFHYIQ